MSSTPEDLEKASPQVSPHDDHLGQHEQGHDSPHHHDNHLHNHVHMGHHSGRRLKRFLHPDGRTVHIAHTPEEEMRIRNHLSVSEPNDNFEVFIHGSPEHLEAIRELHAHHESRREDLRHRHTDVYDEFEHVKSELDALATELHMLTEHGVSLDANFSKFGYSAHLRTKDVESSASSISGDHSFDHGSHDWDAERQQGQRLRFWKRPVVRQYFHKGLLWRASEKEEVGSFELFVDLLYVGIIGIIGDAAAEHPTGDSLLRFSIIFIIGWKIWSDLTLVISWFEADDIFQRLCVMFIMICLFGYTTNIEYAFDTTYTSLISFYLVQRYFAAAYFVFVGYLLPMVRGTMLGNAAMILISGAIWIASIHVDLPGRYGLIWVAIALDLFFHIPIILFMRKAQRKNTGRFMKWAGEWFEFYPAINIEHKTERTNAFVTLVFGASVLAILYQSRAAYNVNAFFGKAILGLIQAFSFNWIYFEIDAFNLHVHAIRRHHISAFLWVSAHLPFVMGYVLASATLSRLVLAHDCSNANPEDLGEAFIAKSEAELSDGLRWFYCGGIGVALLCMSLISLSHVHKKIPNQRLPKRPRVIFRACVALVIVFLPLAHSFNSLDLIATTTSLVFLVLWVDLYGNSCVGDGFFSHGFWNERRKCRYSYSAECKIRRKELRERIRRGEEITLEDLARGDTNADSKGAQIIQ